MSLNTNLVQDHRYWRIRVFYTIYLGYVCFYLTRKSFTFAMPFLSQDLGFSKAELGILATVFYLSYGTSKVVGGLIADKTNTRYFMATGLFAAGVMNIIFGFSSNIILFSLIWCLNGFFQSWGWPACAKTLTLWFNKKERGRVWGLCGTSHNIGGAIMPLAAVFIASNLGWRFAMWLPGILSIIMAVLIFNRLREKPESVGLHAVETNESQNKPNISLTVKDILLGQILTNKIILILASSYFFVYFIRIAVCDWSTFYFMDEKNYSPALASTSVFWFEAGGFCGMLAGGFVSDKIFNGKRLPYCVICFIGIICGVFALSQPHFLGTKFALFYMAIIGFCVFGPQMLVGLAASESVNKNAAATANGFVGMFGYLGAAAAGFPVGYIIDKLNWDGYLYSLMVAGAIGSISVLILILPKQKFIPSKNLGST